MSLEEDFAWDLRRGREKIQKVSAAVEFIEEHQQ